MDNGTLQQEQAAKIKSIVSQTSRSKRRKWMTKSDTHSPGSGSSQESSPSIGGPLGGQGDAPTKKDMFFGLGVVDLNSLDESIWTNFFDDERFMSPSLNGFNSSKALSATGQAFNWEQPLWSPGCAESAFDLSCDLVDAHHSEGIWASEARDNLPTSTAPSWTSTPEKEKMSESCSESIKCNRVQAPKTLSEQQTMAVGGLNRWLCGGESEDLLFMHYLDQVFYIQYPFYDVHGKQKRGWLLSMLKGGKSSYNASLALSEHHLLSTQPPNADTAASLTKQRSKDSHHYLAYQEMELSVGGSRWWNADIRITRSLESLACILQLLFLEVSEASSFPIAYWLTS